MTNYFEAIKPIIRCVDIDFRSLEKTIDYEFVNKELLYIALSHPSLKQNRQFINFARKQKYEYEKLEFLGDNVLSLVMSDILLNNYPNLSHGKLSQMRNYLVSRDCIVEIARSINMDRYVILMKNDWSIDAASHAGSLENTMESLIAAIYFDTMRNINTLYRIISKLWEKEVAYSKNGQVVDPKTTLQEVSYKHRFGNPTYHTQQQNDEHFDFSSTVTVGKHQAKGFGSSKKQAEKNAAHTMLQILEAI